MQVRLVAVAGAYDRDVFVGAVGDHDPGVALPCGHERVLPPREHRLAFVFLHPQVRRSRASWYGLEPHELARAVEDHRSVLARPRIGRQEDVAGGLRARVVVTVTVGGCRSGRETKCWSSLGFGGGGGGGGVSSERLTAVHFGDGEAPGDGRAGAEPAQDGMNGDGLALREGLGRQEARSVALGVGQQPAGVRAAARAGDL